MKYIAVTLLVWITFACTTKKEKPIPTSNHKTQEVSPIIGTWKLVYGEIREKDSVEIKDLSKSEFIKIINDTHFAFFNQEAGTADNFYGGAGTYTLKGKEYTEVLDYLGVLEVRGHHFPFTVEFKGDSLIQYGLEDVPDAGIKRHIVEKYIRVK